jgi:hypothetical protein
MAIRFLKKISFFFFIFSQGIGLLQGASEINSSLGPATLLQQAMRIMLKSLKHKGENINASNYTEIVHEEATLLATLKHTLARKYTSQAIIDVGWSQRPFSYDNHKLFASECAITSLLFTHNQELCATNQKRQLCKMDLESHATDTIKLKSNGRNIAESVEGRFIAVLLQNRKMFVWNRESDTQTTCSLPRIHTRGGQMQTSVKKIDFDDEDNSLVAIMHSRPETLHFSIEELFSNMPQGEIRTKYPRRKVSTSLPKAFCRESYILIRTGIDTKSTSKILTHTEPRAITFNSDYTCLAAGMKDGSINLWHTSDTTHYLLQCAVNKTLLSNNLQDYTTLAKTLRNEKTGPFARLHDKTKKSVLLDLQAKFNQCTTPTLTRDIYICRPSTSETSQAVSSLSRKHELDSNSDRRTSTRQRRD